MPSLTVDEQSILFDATSVPNAFFCEYMPTAPEQYVKVYLYGLMLAHCGKEAPENIAETLAHDLEIKPDEVMAALRYWERNQLIERISDNPPAFRYRNVQQVFLQKDILPKDDDYEQFSAALYAMFAEKRKIHGKESSLAFEWVEKLGLAPEVVLMLINHMIDTRGVNFSFKEAQKEALALKENKITNTDEAEMYFQSSGLLYHGTISVLRKLGSRRAPSEPEIELYRKWTQDWKFTKDAILDACKETVKGTPNFGYLDGILSRIRQHSNDQEISQSTMKKAISASQKENEQIRQLLSTLGQKREIIDDGLRTIYRDLTHYGQDMMQLAAQRCSLHENTRTLDCLSELLNSWVQKGLTDVSAVQNYLVSVDETDRRIHRLASHAGRSIACSKANRELMNKWSGEWAFSQDMIELAAEYAADAKKSMVYIDKLLENWHTAQISTLEAARTEHSTHSLVAASSAHTVPSGKRVIEQNYQQRPTTAEMDDIPPELLEEMNQL